MSTTPQNINRHVLELCARIKATGVARYIEVLPRADSGVSDCFNDVANHVREHGGSTLHGWQIWEWPGVYVEAEFHAVWQNPDGGLADVQRKPDGETRILFLPQKDQYFNGSRRDNIRHAIGKDPLIQTYIQTQNRFFKLFDKIFGNPKGEVRLDGELAEIMHGQKLRLTELMRRYPK